MSNEINQRQNKSDAKFGAGQAVILAAGRGTRMKELTEGTPKSLLQVAGRSLLEYTFDALPEEVEEVIVVVGYLGGAIHDRFGPDYFGKRILYTEMENLHGTAAALWTAKDILSSGGGSASGGKEKFLVLNGDDIYAREDVARTAAAKDWAMLVAKSPALQEGGKIIVDKEGNIASIMEGTHGGESGLVGTNVFLLDTRIFSCEMLPKAPGSPEFGLPQTVLAAAASLKVPLEAITATSWIQISSPEDLQKAEELLKR